MSAQYLLNIKGVGMLDWAAICPKSGRYTNITKVIYELKPSPQKQDDGSVLMALLKRRLKGYMTIKLELKLIIPIYMKSLTREVILIDKKNNPSSFVTFRLKNGQTITHPYSRYTKTALSKNVRDFLLKLKQKLDARDLFCELDCENPGTISIRATVKTQIIEYPTYFIMDLIHRLNTED